jgi:diguanylate cyclase (GGDEF)-like protein
MAVDSTVPASGLPDRALQSVMPEASIAARQERRAALPEDNESKKIQMLPAVLGVREMTVFMVLTVLFIANINGVQSGAPAAFIYWGLGIGTFLIPCAYITRWLAYRYPGQGAPYIWATRILGPYWSFLVAFCAWWPGVFALVAIVDAMLILIQFLAPAWLTTPAQQGSMAIVIIAIATAITCIPLRYLKYLLLALAAVYLSVFALLGGLGAWRLLSGHAAAASFSAPGAWQLNSGNMSLYGVVILALLGVDIPLFMGGEVRGGKQGTRRALSYIWWGTLISALAYLIGTFSVMVIVPPAQAGSLSTEALAVQMVLGPWAGNITAIALILGHLAIAVAYVLMFSRLLVIVAQGRRLPWSLTKLNSRGVPVLSILVMGAIAALVAVCVFIAVPDFVSGATNSATIASEVYNLLQAEGSVLWTLSTLFIFVLALSIAVRRMRKTRSVTRQRMIVVAISIVGVASSFIGVWDTMIASWVPSLIDNGYWTTLMAFGLALSIAAGWLGSEVPRVRAALAEQQRMTKREALLRGQLQEAYDQQQVLVHELHRLYQEQAQAAVTDSVTGLPNHRAVMGRLDEEVSRSERYQTSFALIFVDLDHFKRVNDTWGHRAGDAILREIASRLGSGVRQEDFVGRYGGEEFAVILTGADVAGASFTAERLREALDSEPCSWEMEDSHEVVPIQVSGSFGVAVYRLHGTTREDLIESADYAMYQAKHGGRNRVCIADIDRTVQKRENHPGERDERDEHLYHPLEERDRHIQLATGLQALTAAATARDGYTAQHSQRLVELAVATARQLGQSEEELRMVRLSAALHDIGKIGIPDAILKKPGALTDEEWLIMRTHPDIGRHILEEVGGIFRQLATIVVSHHERWDGTGYPRKLAGEAIPLHARILAVVDAFDAMISHRVYREPLTIEQARSELLRCSGTQFDPAVVHVFLQALDTRQNLLPDTAQASAVP